MEIDEHHQHKDVYTHSLTVLEQAIAQEPDGEPDLVLRLAALLHDIGKPATRRHEPRGGVSFHHHEVVGARLVKARLAALRYPKQVIEDVSRLTYLHLRFHGFSGGEWTDSAVRRYVTDAGPLLSRLHKLVRSDSTTRNRSAGPAPWRTPMTCSSSGSPYCCRPRTWLEYARISTATRSWTLLDIPAGPLVGKAWRYLKELRMDRGPLNRDEAEAELLSWWADQPSPDRDVMRNVPEWPNPDYAHNVPGSERLAGLSGSGWVAEAAGGQRVPEGGQQIGDARRRSGPAARPRCPAGSARRSTIRRRRPD
ncbi:MAG: HDIG domain-containing metalloprotein [Geodermatophilaceae bacterium]